MLKVFSKQAMDIIAYLVKEGYSRRNPFVPKKKPFFIQSISTGLFGSLMMSGVIPNMFSSLSL